MLFIGHVKLSQAGYRIRDAPTLPKKALSWTGRPPTCPWCRQQKLEVDGGAYDGKYENHSNSGLLVYGLDLQ